MNCGFQKKLCELQLNLKSILPENCRNASCSCRCPLKYHFFAEISQILKFHALKFTFTFTFTFFSSLYIYNSMENMFLLELHIFAEIPQNLNSWAHTLNGVSKFFYCVRSFFRQNLQKMILKCRHVYFN